MKKFIVEFFLLKNVVGDGERIQYLIETAGDEEVAIHIARDKVSRLLLEEEYKNIEMVYLEKVLEL
jgi:hypothetical protein